MTIAVYSKPGCVQCTATTRALSARGLSFQVIDLTLDDAAFARVSEMGYRQVPVVVAGDAFAAHPHGLAPVQAAFDAASKTDWPMELTPSLFGVTVPEGAAIVVALSVIYADPVASLS